MVRLQWQLVFKSQISKLNMIFRGGTTYVVTGQLPPKKLDPPNIYCEKKNLPP